MKYQVISDFLGAYSDDFIKCLLFFLKIEKFSVWSAAEFPQNTVANHVNRLAQ